MFFHSRLKENLLCAVFLFSKIIFFYQNNKAAVLPAPPTQNGAWDENQIRCWEFATLLKQP